MEEIFFDHVHVPSLRHSPQIEVLENQCRRIWEDWDDYPVERVARTLKSEEKKKPVYVKTTVVRDAPITPVFSRNLQKYHHKIYNTKTEINDLMNRFRKGENKNIYETNDQEKPNFNYNQTEYNPKRFYYHQNQQESELDQSEDNAYNIKNVNITAAETIEAERLKRENQRLKEQLTLITKQLVKQKAENQSLLEKYCISADELKNIKAQIT